MGRYMGRVALELIGQAVIGHSFDPLTESHSHPYTEALKDLVYVFIIPFCDHLWALTSGMPPS